MRTDRPEPPAAPLGRLQTAWRQARRRAVALGPGGRLAVLAGGLVVLAILGYAATPDPQARFTRLYPDHAFAPEEAGRIVRLLVARSIEAQTVEGRVEVPAEKLALAYTEIQKAGLEPRSARAIIDAPTAAGPFASAAEIARQEQRQQEQFLEALIRDAAPDISALVRIYRDRPLGLQREGPQRLSVQLTSDRDQPISPRTIEKLRTILEAFGPAGLDPDRLTLLDSNGTSYAVAGDPIPGLRARLRAREDDLRERLLQRLDWIGDARVVVAMQPLATPTVEAPRAETQPEIRVNGPMPPIPDPAAPDPAEPPAPGSLDPEARAAITVLVPNTYFVRVAREQSGNESPSSDMVRHLLAETETAIREVVAGVVSPSELARPVTIMRIFTPLPARPVATTLATAPKGRLGAGRWLALAGAGGLLGVVALRLAGSRRRRTTERAPHHLAASPARRARFDAADAAGPSARVRELIRRDPAAGAGVLRRWIEQGGLNP